MNKSNRIPKAAILAVGTEITNGEVINTNAAFIAAELSELGFLCDHHAAVPDDRAAIATNLANLVLDHQLVFITGGLGPTTDDFTRDVIANVSKHNLVWSEDDWQRILRRLNSVGAPFAESNKQQAYFPNSAEIFPSAHGTASAFRIKIGSCDVIALPGPPREIKGLWQDHIKSLLQNLNPDANSQNPEVWTCLGQSESRLGEIVEAALAGSGLQTGYRSHMPYIHVKVWILPHQMPDFNASWKQKLESALAPWLVGQNNFDAALNLQQAATRIQRLVLIDSGTRGYAAKRLFAAVSAQSPITVITSDITTDLNDIKPTSNRHTATISVVPESGELNITFCTVTGSKQHTEVTRYIGQQNAERLRTYAAERAFLKLADWINSTVEEVSHHRPLFEKTVFAAMARLTPLPTKCLNKVRRFFC